MGSLIGKLFTGNVVFTRPTTILLMGVVRKGGYVYFSRELETGWYYWHRDWKARIHKKRKGIVFKTDEDGCKFVAVVPDMWEYEQDDDVVIIIGHDEEMQGRDRTDY